MSPYKDFTAPLKLLISKNSDLITTTLSNIFTMRLIGNKTHGDLAEIAIAEFINQFMYDFKSVHVGKELYRAKEHEEDIKIINEITKAEFPVSLKAYGDGPLQLSTDKNFQMFPRLQSLGALIEGSALAQVWVDPVFADFGSMNILPLIYDEKKQRCNILVFDAETARARVARIALEEAGHGRKTSRLSLLRRRWWLRLRSALRERNGQRIATGSLDAHEERFEVFPERHQRMD